MKGIIQSIPLHNLSSLSISNPIPAETFVQSFGKCQHLGVIDFFSDGVAGWTEAMQTIDKMALESQVHRVAFPGLHTISITEAAFHKAWDFDFKVFEGWLRNRHNHNVGLKELTLSKCPYIGEPEVQSLRRLVDKVNWDGYTVTAFMVRA